VNEQQLSLAELVRNGTLNADMAAALWAAVDEQISFVTAAVPQLAGKSTLSKAVLAMRPPDVAVRPVRGEAAEIEALKQERQGGYLTVEEFSHYPVMPGYIWGEPVRRVFSALEAGYALQATLHAGSVAQTLDEIVAGNGVSEADASRLKLVLYVERFGTNRLNFWRRLVELYELHKVEDGKPIGHPLYRWQADGDRFEKVSDPHQWGRDRDDLARRAAILQELAGEGRTDMDSVRDAVAKFRAGKRSS
jgi:Flp pilus assembly CpaF family ATPase